MLDMAVVDYIRYLYEKKGESLRKITEETGCSFQTVKKYVEMEYVDPEDHKVKRAPHYPKLGPFIPIINGWLEGDRKAWFKQRHTAQRIYERLCDEHGYDGSSSSVRRYVKKWKDAMRLALDKDNKRTEEAIKKGCIARVKEPGVAEADFCEVHYLDDAGQEQKAYAFLLSFVYSNLSLIQICPSVNQQCFMQSLKDCLEHIGGVPERIRIDNASTVVAKAREGDQPAVLTDAFKKFQACYHFIADPCNLHAGQEKGNVERAVHTLRQRAMVPYPVITSFPEFNKKLWVLADKMAQKQHYSQHRPIIELWQKDKARLLNLPKRPFEVFRSEVMSVNKCGYVTFETNRYGLCPELNGLKVLAKIYNDHLDFFFNEQKLATYPRLYGRDKEICRWEMYLGTLLYKPGALEGSRFYDTMPMPVRKFLTRVQGKERKRAVRLLMDMVADGGTDLCAQVLQMAEEKGRLDVDSARQIYCVLTKKEEVPEPLRLKSTGPALNYTPNLDVYDQLTRGRAHA